MNMPDERERGEGRGGIVEKTAITSRGCCAGSSHKSEDNGQGKDDVGLH